MRYKFINFGEGQDPVRKKRSRPIARWNRAITSAVTASYACLSVSNRSKLFISKEFYDLYFSF